MMDKVSQLLAEAKPLYLKKQKEKRAVLSGLFSLALFFAVWQYPVKTVAPSFSEEGFDSYFTALYMNDTEIGDDFYDENIGYDAYVLYEVG